MDELRAEINELKAEVDLLRAELRLIKRKLRDKDSDDDEERLKHIVEDVLSDTLDQQYYWKMVRYDPRITNPVYMKERGKRNRARPDKSRSQGLTFRSRSYSSKTKGSFRMDSDSDINMEDGVDYEYTSDHTRKIDDADFDDTENHSESFKHSAFDPNSFSFQTPISAKHAKKPKLGLGLTPSRQGATLEFKLKVCRRAKQIGPTAAGREFKTGESTVRLWSKKLKAAGHTLESSDENNEDDPKDDTMTQGMSDGGIGELNDSSFQTVNHEETTEEGNDEKCLDSLTAAGKFGKCRSDVWNYFVPGKVTRPGVRREPAICKACKSEVSAEARRLRNHLEKCEYVNLKKVKSLKSEGHDESESD